MKILRAARALAKIKAITKPPKIHSRTCGLQFFTESFQNIQLTGCVYGLHAFHYNPAVFRLATRNPEYFWRVCVTAPEAPMTERMTHSITTSLLALVFALFSTLALAQESRVYQLNNRTSADVANQIKELYQQAPVSVSARGQQLVVRGEPGLLDEIGMLIESIDVPPVQMRISVRYRQDIGGKQSGGGVTVSGNQAGANVERRTISTNSNTERQLMVQDGQSAHITSGNVRTIPFAVQGGRNPAAILEQVETRSGFIVTPQAISDQTVELNIVSFEEDPASIQGYETEALMTIRRVEPGQWVTLGGTSTSQSHRQDGITYRVTGNRSENQSVDVKVDILP